MVVTVVEILPLFHCDSAAMEKIVYPTKFCNQNKFLTTTSTTTTVTTVIETTATTLTTIVILVFCYIFLIVFHHIFTQ